MKVYTIDGAKVNLFFSGIIVTVETKLYDFYLLPKPLVSLYLIMYKCIYMS